MKARTDRAEETRSAILRTAERMFAEHGLFAVSNRQVSEAAGQGNNAAVGYHFGTKADLVRAIVRRHTGPVEQLRQEMVPTTGSAELRDWVGCLVRPSTEHLAALGNPTWFARFGAQVMTDPGYRPIMVEESLGSPALRLVMDGLDRCLPELPAEVRAERSDMSRQLMVHMCAERERALDEGTATPRGSWQAAADGLVDAISGLWVAPVTSR